MVSLIGSGEMVRCHQHPLHGLRQEGRMLVLGCNGSCQRRWVAGRASINIRCLQNIHAPCCAAGVIQAEDVSWDTSAMQGLC